MEMSGKLYEKWDTLLIDNETRLFNDRLILIMILKFSKGILCGEYHLNARRVKT